MADSPLDNRQSGLIVRLLWRVGLVRFRDLHAAVERTADESLSLDGPVIAWTVLYELKKEIEHGSI